MKTINKEDRLILWDQCKNILKIISKTYNDDNPIKQNESDVSFTNLAAQFVIDVETSEILEY